jgi:hypothetical protein
MQFRCNQCSHLFDADGIKQEYASPTYGPCFKWVASCTECGAESNEYRKPTGKRASSTIPSTPACGCGNCCGRG